ncbi:MAG TPA: FG-GAP repeat protein [Pyrinomonadaceae bacterium]|jgi:hypothetical protein|nr:FG-GAP repeat protein [Pyrinomonadaceae bacterium]
MGKVVVPATPDWRWHPQGKHNLLLQDHTLGSQNGWAGDLIESAKLMALDGAPFDVLGSSVAISGDTLAVGA